MQEKEHRQRHQAGVDLPIDSRRGSHQGNGKGEGEKAAMEKRNFFVALTDELSYHILFNYEALERTRDGGQRRGADGVAEVRLSPSCILAAAAFLVRCSLSLGLLLLGCRMATRTILLL
jgi:hypothetical protein